MKSLADWVALAVLVFVLMGILLISSDDGTRWKTKRSPETGICYELRVVIWPPFIATEAMSPVDDSYCEEMP